MNPVRIKITNVLTLQGGSPDFVSEIRKRLSFQNPAWLENEKMGRWNGKTPEVLRFYRDDPSGLILPRGFIGQLISMARRSGERYQTEDRRRLLPTVDFTFSGRLRPFQEQAVKEMMSRDFGTLSAPTGSGKTIMALAMVVHRRQPTLIITHTKELLNQWTERIEQFLGIPADEIGKIGDGKKAIGSRITVALVQSVYKYASEISPRTGCLIIDECHRTPSRTFTEAVSAFDCRYMTGLSATPWRRDRLSKLIFWFVGDVIHEIGEEGLIESGDVLPFEVVTRETDFLPFADPTTEYSAMLRELTANEERNRLIVKDVVGEASNGGGVSLVLTDRKMHCEILRGLLAGHGIETRVLTGGVPDAERREIVEGLQAGRVKVLVATGQLIGEGFDCPGLSTLFFATPIRFSGRVIQYLGRVLRPAPGKAQAKVYDYVDHRVGVLKASFYARRKVYGIGAEDE